MPAYPQTYHRKDYFYCGIDKNGNIIDVDNKGSVIGIDNIYANELRDKIKQLEETLEEWRPLMIKHGYITEPKTPEELIEEQKDIIYKQGETIEKLSEQMENLMFMIGRLSNGQSSELRHSGGDSKEQNGISVKNGGKRSGNKNTSERVEKLHFESGELSVEQQAQTNEYEGS